jgi:hypothetical protein
MQIILQFTVTIKAIAHQLFFLRIQDIRYLALKQNYITVAPEFLFFSLFSFKSFIKICLIFSLSQKISSNLAICSTIFYDKSTNIKFRSDPA